MKVIPYGQQTIESEDLAAVAEALTSGWLTTGPRVEAFEAAFAQSLGAKHAVAVNSGTAALHCAMRALNIGPGDEVIVPALTFAATANSVVYEGGTPVFADIEADTLLIDPDCVAALITPRTKAIAAVDFAGQPADYDALDALAQKHGLTLVADACHAPGGRYNGRPVGTLAAVSTFSFHPVKHLTTAEGGMCLTQDENLARHMRRFRNHGIDSDHRQRATNGTFGYDMLELGYNYRLNDVQCALGMAQLPRLPGWVRRRQAIAAMYDEAFVDLAHVRPLAVRSGRSHAYHLYVVELDLEKLGLTRAEAFDRLRGQGIGANVHYPPLHLMSYYRQKFGCSPGLCPVTERLAGRILTLPVYPAMQDGDVERVVECVAALLK